VAADAEDEGMTMDLLVDVDLGHLITEWLTKAEEFRLPPKKCLFVREMAVAALRRVVPGVEEAFTLHVAKDGFFPPEWSDVMMFHGGDPTRCIVCSEPSPSGPTNRWEHP
jgi:hypothetical protein